MPLDSLIATELLSTCSALGCDIKGRYEKDPDCVECLKDLIRFLRRDDENHCVLRQLGDIRVLQTDLLPLLKGYSKDKELLDLILRLLVILTNPALLVFKEEIPEDKLSSNVYLEIITFLQSYKEAFTDTDVWTALNNNLQNMLQMNYEDRDEDDRLTVERILILIRNILHVPPDSTAEKRTDDDVSVHDQVLWALHKSGIEDLILYLSGNEDEDQYCFHVLEIIMLLLREQKPETLVTAGQGRSATQKENDEKKLMALRKKEELQKMNKIRNQSNISRFNGVFYVKNMKSISDREFISHKLITDLHAVKFDKDKVGRRKPKNRQPAAELDVTRRSTLSICLFLKSFCSEFLIHSYNSLMSIVKSSLLQRRSEDHDESYYLWAMHYFLEFNRLNGFRLDIVSETVSVQTFHYIQTQMDNYYDMLTAEKKKTSLWSKRMHLALKAYKELLMTLAAMDEHHDDNVRECANVIKENVFYIVEYREMLLSLFTSCDEIKFSLSYFKDLVEATHIFLRMLEKYGKRHSHLVIQKKNRKCTKRKKKQVNVTQQYNIENQLDDEWDSIAGNLSAVLQGRGEIPIDISPFDATLDIRVEEQRVEAVYKIRNALSSKESGKAVALLRAAREVWPENDSFGSADIEPEEEFLALREIFLSNLQRPAEVSEPVHNEEEEEYEDEEENVDMFSARVSEQQFNFDDFIKRFASPKVVQPCARLLANYQNNASYTNKCIVKMLHRIAWDCKMHGLLFQASVFLVFQKILNDQDVHVEPAIKELSRFAKFIVRKFFENTEKNKKAFIELLLWKGPREVYEMEVGYETYGNISSKLLWTEEEEEELKCLFEEYKNGNIENNDIIDMVIESMRNKDKSRKQVMHKLKNMGLIDNLRDFCHKPAMLRGEWQEVEIIELQQLFEKHKSSADVMGNILNDLTIKRSRKLVVDKLLELHLIDDRKEVRKKRDMKSKTKKTSLHGHDSDLKLESHNDTSNKSESSEEESSLNDEHSTMQNENKKLENETYIADFDKSISKNQNIEWEEVEVVELNQIFEEYRGSPDLVEHILTNLKTKRSQTQIIQKLLELKLINDAQHFTKMDLSNLSKESIFTDLNETENSSSLIHNDDFGKDDSNKCKISMIITEKPETLKEKNKLKIGKTKLNSRNREWQEIEVIELHQLYEEHKNSDDVIKSIINNLSIKRPRSLIINKLLELGLISDRKEIRKKRMKKHQLIANDFLKAREDTESIKKANKSVKEKKKDTKKEENVQFIEWQENEIIELHQLFEKQRNTTDIMRNILKGLTVKRPKKLVINKLLELELISSHKEVAKTVKKTDFENLKGSSQHNGLEGEKFHTTQIDSSVDKENIDKKVHQKHSEKHHLSDHEKKCFSQNKRGLKRKMLADSVKRKILIDNSDSENASDGFMQNSKEINISSHKQKELVKSSKELGENKPLISPEINRHISKMSTKQTNHRILEDSDDSDSTVYKTKSADLNENYVDILKKVENKKTATNIEELHSPFNTDVKKRKRQCYLIHDSDSSGDENNISNSKYEELVTKNNENDITEARKRKRIQIIDDSD